MKKILLIFLTVITVFMLFALKSMVFAASGDVIGCIYSTDIRAYINGIEVQSYNIGGRTAVVIENILNENAYHFDNSSRNLEILNFSTGYIIEDKTTINTEPGRIMENIYETDIKTSIYDVIVPSYNIGGKTAVAIEDLGNDRKFSAIGGKYIWDEENRTISLEFLHERAGILSRNKNIHITLNEDMTEAEATFEETFHCGGQNEFFTFPDYVTDDADIEVILPIKAQGEIIGYYFRKKVNNKITDFTYYYHEKFDEAQKVYTPATHKTREEIISHFVGAHSMGEARERFDAENYSFVYISVAGTSWTSYNLVQAYDDGTYIDYKDEIATKNRSPHNLIIDKENEKVTFKYVDRYTSEWFINYEIDLKNGKIKPI